MEASKTSSHFLRVEAYNQGEQKPNKMDGRVDVFVNGKCILGAPMWDLPLEYPFVSTYRLDNTYDALDHVSKRRASVSWGADP